MRWRHRLDPLLILLCFLLLPAYAQEDDSNHLAYGASVSGRLSDATPRIVYTFDGQRGEVVNVDLSVTAGNLDPVLTILNATGNVLLNVDDLAGSRTPSVSGLRIPQSARYEIIIGRYGYDLGSTSGGFELEVDRVGVSSESGSMLRYGDQVINTISNMTPQLYYSFRAHQGDIINVRMRRVSGNLDPYLQIVDSDAFVLADNDDTLGAAVPFDSFVQALVIEKDGIYVIVASRYGQAAGTSSGNFVLTLEEADNSGLGNTALTAIPIQLDQSLTGEITAQQHQRYYRFDAHADDIITIRMLRGSGFLDSYLVLADSGLVELAVDDDSAENQNALIDKYRIPADGSYYIIATRYDRDAGTSTGAYRLDLINDGNAFADVPEDVPHVNYGTTVTGRISDEAPELLYAFWGVEGDTITVSMNRSDGNLDPVVSVLDSEQHSLISDDDSGGGQNARIGEFTVPVTGTYYIQAARFHSGTATTEGSFVLVLARRFN